MLQIVRKLEQRQVPKDLDFLKIDVDSFDCEFLDAIVSGGIPATALLSSPTIFLVLLVLLVPCRKST